MDDTLNRRTIIFVDTVDANSKLTLVSRRIPFTFRTIEVQAHFALNTNRTLKLYYFISADESAPTTEPPEGINFLKTLGGSGYIVGDDEHKNIPVTINVKQTNMVLKLYADNTDGFEHSIDSLIIIEPLERS